MSILPKWLTGFFDTKANDTKETENTTTIPVSVFTDATKELWVDTINPYPNMKAAAMFSSICSVCCEINASSSPTLITKNPAASALWTIKNALDAATNQENITVANETLERLEKELDELDDIKDLIERGINAKASNVISIANHFRPKADTVVSILDNDTFEFTDDTFIIPSYTERSSKEELQRTLDTITIFQKNIRVALSIEASPTHQHDRIDPDTTEHSL